MSKGRLWQLYISQPMEMPFTVVPWAVLRFGLDTVPNESLSEAEDITTATMFSAASWKFMNS